MYIILYYIKKYFGNRIVLEGCSLLEEQRLSTRFFAQGLCHLKIFFFCQGSVNKLQPKNQNAYFQECIITFTLKFELEFVLFLIWGTKLFF